MDKYQFREMLEYAEGHIGNDNWTINILKHFDQLMSECIHWTTEDFEMQARNMADDNWEEVFDKTKFQSALEQMVRKHDADMGITWDTITYYLNEKCKKDENNI